jgi:hypothetical protein
VKYYGHAGIAIQKFNLIFICVCLVEKKEFERKRKKY